MSMTSRERLLSAMRLEKPDRVPVGPILTTSWLAEADTQLAERVIRETDPLLVAGVAWDTQFFLGEISKEICHDRVEGNQYIRTIQTPKGELRSVTTSTDKSQCVTEFFFKDLDDVEKFLSVPYEPLQIDPSEYMRLKDQYGDEVLVLADFLDAVYLPGFWFSPEDFMVNCLVEYDTIKQLLEIGHSRLMDALRSFKASGIDVYRIIGAELASQTMMDPSWFSKLVAPYDTELHAEMRQGGGVAYMHCHGKISDILEEIAAAGPTALDPLEAPPGGNLDLADVKRRIGDNVCLVGNLDDMQVIGPSSHDELIQLSKACIEAAGPEGYILGGTASGIYTRETAEGFLAMAEASRSMA